MSGDLEKVEERNGCHCGEPGPRCEYHSCGKPADWLAMSPIWRKTPPFWAPKFFCDTCLIFFRAAVGSPLTEYWPRSVIIGGPKN